MSSSRDKIEIFLKHQGVNNAWLAGELWGKRSASNTSRLRKKLLGIEGRDFTPEELIRLDEIRKNFIRDFL